MSSAVPPGARWLFWDVDPDAIDVVRDRDFVIPRVIEHGGMSEVRWLIAVVGLEEIHRFLRELPSRTAGSAATSGTCTPWRRRA